MIEGSGSGSIPLTSGSGSGRPKNMWIRWIRIWIRNTGIGLQKKYSSGNIMPWVGGRAAPAPAPWRRRGRCWTGRGWRSASAAPWRSSCRASSGYPSSYASIWQERNIKVFKIKKTSKWKNIARTEALDFFVYSITSRMKKYIEYKFFYFFIFVIN